MGRMLACLLFVTLVALGGGLGEAAAADDSPEQMLRSATERARRVVESQLLDPGASGNAAALRRVYEEILACHLLLTERWHLREELLRRGETLGVERHRVATANYTAAISRVLEAFARTGALPETEDSSLKELLAALDELAPPRRPAIHGILPYHQPRFQTSKPREIPRIIPAYRQPVMVSATADDLAGSPEAPVSPMISSQAKRIAATAGRSHWDPAAIYNWVRENIHTEWYWGSMKGAEETLRQKSGNAADQASLLVALLRASGYPARYVRGVAEFFPGLEAARNATGVDDPEQLPAFFQAAGIPCDVVRADGAIVTLRFEHVWVEALVPYDNYRGMEAATTGKLWIPMDTSLKTGGFVDAPAIDLLSLPGNPLSTFRERYLADVREQTPLDMLRQEIDLFLSVQQPGHGYTELLHSRLQQSAPLAILPSTLQFVDAVVTGEYATLPRDLQHQVRLLAVADDPEASPLFDLSVPLRELSNRQVMIGFEPETVADQELINRWGGLDSTPAYLARLRPTVVVGGERMAVAADGLSVGGEFSLSVTFSAPAGETSVSDKIHCGYPLLLGIVAQKALPPERDSLPAAAPELLHRSALSYIEAWNRSESELAELFNLALVRPMPTFVAVGGRLGVDGLAGLPCSVVWEGLFIDANLRAVAAVPRITAANDRVRNFREISALEGSVQEHRIFETEFNVESISTSKLLGLARVSGLPLITIDADNVAEQLPLLAVDAAVRADIADAIAMGQIVLIPAAQVTQAAWSGIGYLKEDPVTGEAGYMLSGGLAGGQTVLGRRDWTAEAAAIMAQPFTGPPNEDPAQAFSLTAVTPPELLLATAGEELSGSLMVLVRDMSGIPVAGAPVLFRVRSGGGWLLDDTLHPGENLSELNAVSGRDGIARVRFSPGTSTFVNAVVYAREGDRHANIVGENLIDAQLTGGSMAQLASPIVIFGFAGPPDVQMSKAYGNNLTGEVLSYSGQALLLFRDRFGNPVANHPVTFAALTAEPLDDSACQNPPGLTAGQYSAQLVDDSPCLQRLPVHGECSAATSVKIVSRTDGGAQAGVILGGVPHARYQVTAGFATHAGPGNAAWSHYSRSFASCHAASAPENRLVLRYLTRQDDAGNNVDARPSGSPSELLVKSWLLAEEAEIATKAQTMSCAPLPDLDCDMVVGNGAFSMLSPTRVAVGGKLAERAAPMTNSTVLPWLYRGTVTLPVGLANIAMEASAERVMPRIVNNCQGCGDVESKELSIGPTEGAIPVWGVDLDVPEVATVLVDSHGISQHDALFSFAIRPAQYVANLAQVLLYRDGELWDTLATGTSGSPSVVLPAGYYFDPKASYELQVLLNNAGDANEIQSRRIPLLPRTAAVDLQIEGLPAAFEDQVGAFVLLNGDYDERDANPDESLPDAATPGILVTDDELKRAWLLIEDSTVREGTWRVRASNPEKLRIYRQKDGVWSEFRPDDPPEPITDFPALIPLYLEGLAESAALRGDDITATFFPAGALEVKDVVPLTTIDLDLAVDGNRDRTLDFQDSRDERALFWVNNDHDIRDTEDGQPVEDDAAAGNDSADARILCKRDLEDFARLHIHLGAADPVRALTYTLEMVAADEQIQPMLNIFPAINLSDGYLGLPSEKATPEQPDEQLAKSLLAAVGKTPTNISSANLPIKGGANPFIYEGRKYGRGKLVLTANYLDVPVVSRSVALELVDPSWFYDHFVLSQAGGSESSPVKATVNPEGMADGASRLGLYQPPDNEYVLFVHGWNMSGWEKKRWAETIVKRLWWQGYQGKVGLFDWPCNTFELVPGPTNYDRSEFKAWQSAAALTDVLERLSERHPGQIRLLAHSQGNVVAGEALRLGEPGLVHTYVASQAALSAGFYDYFHPKLAGFAPKTPDVMSAYPDGQEKLPYLYRVASKVVQWFNYFNVTDYALTGDSVDQPTWLLNNRTRPDGSLGYGYEGDELIYPPVGYNAGFFRSVLNAEGNFDRFSLKFPDSGYEIFSFCAQSWTCALGASNMSLLAVTDTIDLSLFGYDRGKSSHSRQFRSNVVDEQKYWQRFMRDAALVKQGE